ncbi:hypothetical protein QMK54_17895 [Pseudomonas sp. P5_109]|uniref:hypothetical protein n=1 Tax=unclassified Pseudomonas TaxID=196821 RepID=UPI001CBE8344|nr:MULTISPECIES: hypothetical protein [unclassified Pseudomonas]WPN27712.1 hypothetical protein QMK54_17895 [Pseudomonas sp. P5_109]
MSALQPLCQPATERLQLSANTDSWAWGMVTALELLRAKARRGASDWCTLLRMALYKSARTVRFHSSFELKPVSGNPYCRDPSLYDKALIIQGFIVSSRANAPITQVKAKSDSVIAACGRRSR